MARTSLPMVAAMLALAACAGSEQDAERQAASQAMRAEQAPVAMVGFATTAPAAVTAIALELVVP